MVATKPQLSPMVRQIQKRHSKGNHCVFDEARLNSATTDGVRSRPFSTYAKKWQKLTPPLLVRTLTFSDNPPCAYVHLPQTPLPDTSPTNRLGNGI
jgi:hypothetical protein